MIHKKPQSKNVAKRGRSWHQNGKTTKCTIYNFLDLFQIHFRSIKSYNPDT